MKKSAILAFAAAVMLGQSVVAQNNVKEITYVEDATQGYLFNNFSSNWFITLQGGVANVATKGIARPSFGDRFNPAAGLYIGKYFSPLIGVRAGFDWFQGEGVNEFKLSNYGAAGDVILNLTNWWCGYNPDRLFNASVYAGLGGYFNSMKGRSGWENAHHQFITARAGLLIDFNLSRNFALGLDLRAVGADKSMAELSNNKSVAGEILVSATYKFNKATWNAPVVAVVPEIEDCEPIKARLQAANARIEDLEAQLRACLNRPVEKVVETSKAPLATIYFTIGNSTLNNVDRKVLKSVAEEMKASGKNYTITGWADTYTGTDAINARLRENRAKNVEKVLIQNGVPASKLTTKSGAGNLNDLGLKQVDLARCATIEESK